MRPTGASAPSRREPGGTAIGNSAPYRGLVAGLFAQDFAAPQRVWVEGFLTLLVELRRVFGNDMDKVMILSAIGQQFLREPALVGTPRIEVERQDVAPGRQSTTNIDALVRATGIPRESVRRKVNELIGDALVARGPDGGLHVAAGVAARMQASTDVTVEMLDMLFGTYYAMLVAQGRVPTLPSRKPGHSGPEGDQHGTP
jgi:hypothetical protein